MNKFITLLLPAVKILGTVVQGHVMQKSYKHLIKKLLSYAGAVFFIISAYIFACMALYSFLWPHVGEALAALSICFLFLILGLGFMIMARKTKAQREVPSPPKFSNLENYLDFVPDSQELMRGLKKASPQILATVLGGLAITALVKIFKK